MKDYHYITDIIERIYNEGFSSQALTERLEGATELEQQQIREDMSRESVLCKPTLFADGICRLQWACLGKSGDAYRQLPSLQANETEATITFHTKPQPLFHKNFELLRQSLSDFLLQGYKIYILANSVKQQQRLRDIFNEMDGDRDAQPSHDAVPFIPVDRTVHEGSIDDDAKICCFTDHQIFDRFHKYSIKTDKARSGKVAITMKEPAGDAAG